MAAIPFDWTKGFDITSKVSLPVEDQNGSSSCGGQALRYYLEALKCLKTGTFERLSAKDSYCQIFYPGGGTTIRDIGRIAVQVGVKNEVTVPSYQNGAAPQEWFMEDKNVSRLTSTASKFAEFGFAFPAVDIESIAQAIRDNSGMIIQVSGQNNGTWLSNYPKAPTVKEWSHFLYAGKAVTINGKKYIGVLNSWGADAGENGWQYLDENYFKGWVTNSLVLYDNTVYAYQPSPLQTTATWLQKFLQWFNLYPFNY